MRVPLPIALLLALAAFSCGPTFHDSDLVGKWPIDPSSLVHAKNPEAMRDTAIELAPSHLYTFTVQPRIQILGVWRLTRRKVSLSPTTLRVLSNGKTKDEPVARAIANMKVRTEKSDPGANLSKIDALGAAINLTVSSDGKALTDVEGLVWKKQP